MAALLVSLLVVAGALTAIGLLSRWRAARRASGIGQLSPIERKRLYQRLGLDPVRLTPRAGRQVARVERGKRTDA